MLVKPDTRLKAVRTPPKAKTKPHRPNQWWNIDMTRVMVQGFGWMNISQPTSVGFMKTRRDLDIHQAFTSYNNSRGNADTERVFRTMKEELLWLREWTSPFELSDALGRWIGYYNERYLHSTLGYKSPIKFEEEYQNSQVTLFVTS